MKPLPNAQVATTLKGRACPTKDDPSFETRSSPLRFWYVFRDWKQWGYTRKLWGSGRQVSATSYFTRLRHCRIMRRHSQPHNRVLPWRSQSLTIRVARSTTWRIWNHSPQVLRMYDCTVSWINSHWRMSSLLKEHSQIVTGLQNDTRMFKSSFYGGLKMTWVLPGKLRISRGLSNPTASTPKPGSFLRKTRTWNWCSRRAPL